MPADNWPEENKRLERCPNDLVGLALPDIRAGREPAQIADALIDALVELLRPEFAYFRLNESIDGAAAEWARSRSRRDIRPHEIGRTLERWLAADTSDRQLVLPNPVGDGVVSAAVFRLGLPDEVGRVIVGSERSDFPTPTEQLLMHLAANQAAIGLQHARHLRQQRRARKELEHRVGERSAELAAANRELLKEILERAHAQAELELSERRYAIATTAGGVGVWDWNLLTGEIHVDAALKRALGFEDHEIANHIDSWGSHAYPGDAAHVRRAAEAVIEGSIPALEVEHRMLHKDGTIRWFLARGSAVRSPDGRAVRMVGTETDITEAETARARLQDTRDELARLSRLTALGQFAASIAHDVSQPLCAILMNSRACLQLLSHLNPPLPEIATALQEIADAGNRAKEMMQRYRALFQNPRVEKLPLDINGVIRQVIPLVRSRLHRSDIALTTSLGDDVPALTGDRAELQQVLLNLIVNAADALEGVHGRSRQIRIDSCLTPDATVRISVRDNGIGLQNVNIDRLFILAYTTKPSNAGIGLSVSRSIVEAHGGRLWAEPNDVQGATFCFTIPPTADRPAGLGLRAASAVAHIGVG